MKLAGERIRGLVLASILACGGCAPQISSQDIPWFRTETFGFKLPHKWEVVSEDPLVMTRDGLALQSLTLGRMADDEELAYTRKPLAGLRTTDEIAAAVVADLHANPNLQNQEVVETGSAIVGGSPGIKIVYRYRTGEGLSKKVFQYGVVRGNWYYYLIFEAPERYYFDRDRATFEDVRESFKMTELRNE